MSTARSYDPNEFLTKVVNAFWANGYGATSLADLVAATGVNRGSIYAAFSGKRDLFLAALGRYDEVHRVEFLAKLAAGYSDRDAILAAFAQAARDGDGTPPGCLLVNTATELAPHDPEIAAFVTNSLSQVEAFFADRLRDGQTRGTIPSALPVKTTATALLGLFLGLRVLTRAGADQHTRDSLLSQAEAMLG